jgi:SOS-response transcriptional repressor LexA
MNETETLKKPIRPTRTQKVLLDFVSAFITEHGYSPSYREIMVGMNYGSVGTVAVHVNNLIKRGHLVKRGTSARSLELVKPIEPGKINTNQVLPKEEKWLVDKIDYAFAKVETEVGAITEASLEPLYVLIGALKVLGLEGAAQSFSPRLTTLKTKHGLQ